MTLESLEKRLVFYDFEVFAYDWLVVFTDYITGNQEVFHNNPEGVVEYLKSRKMINVGYNNKHYDQYILKAVCSYYEPSRIKEVNDYIIAEQQQGWTYNYDTNMRMPKQMDMMDDIVPRKSLKMLEGFMGMNIVESSVPFDIDRKLTPEEVEESIHYCKHDVFATIAVYKARRSQYVASKLKACEIGNVDAIEGVCATNAKLTAMVYKAEPVNYGDERDYVYHERIDMDYIPSEIVEFYDQLHDPSVSDDEVYKMKLKDIDILGVLHTYAWGGLHGAVPNLTITEVPQGKIIVNWDFESYYPHLRWKNGYSSRAANVDGLDELLIHEKHDAKASKDYQTAGGVKLIINTAYGAMLEQFNKLFDPLNGRSICITGQLYLTELLFRIAEGVNSFELQQSNTDGVMFMIDECDRQIVTDIVADFVKKVDIPMEEEVVTKLAQKDVNNYVAIIDGKLKYKGGMTSSYEPSFDNRNLEIVDRALVDYFAYGTDPAETVNKCTDILAFQMVQKVGSSYSRVIHESHDCDPKKEVVLQRVNRIYASKNKALGKIKKVKLKGDIIWKDGEQVVVDKDRRDTMQNCPPHAIVDNENQLKLIDIDKSWYIRLAVNRINQFKGKEDKKMSDETRDIMSMDISKLNKAEVVQRCRIVETELGSLKEGGELSISAEQWDELNTQLKTLSDKYRLRNEAYKELEKAYDHLKQGPVSSSASGVVGINSKMLALQQFLCNYEWEMDGYNDQTSSEYITGKQYKEALRHGISAVGLLYRSGIENVDSYDIATGTGKKMFWARLEATPEFIDPDSGESYSTKVFTEAADMLDKALLKCNTGIAKAIVQTDFLITDASDKLGDGDNTEKEESKGGFVPKAVQDKKKEEVLSQDQEITETQKSEITTLINKVRELSGKATYGQAVLDKMSGYNKTKASTTIMKLEDKIDDLEG